jgi:glycosyltransferase involved in cell wall biosynthesis
LVGRGVVGEERIRVIYNGLEMPTESNRADHRRATREELEITEVDFVWLAVGRTEPSKDYDTLIGAVSRCRGQTDRFTSRLLIAGGGSDLERLKEEVERRQLSDTIRFLGYRQDVERLSAAADAQVMSSAWEGMPNALIEGSSRGLPIVATDVGGVREVVEDGVSGFIVEAGEPAKLAEAMTRMEKLSSEQRGALGNAGRDIVSQEFAINKVVDEWERVIGDCNRHGRCLE